MTISITEDTAVDFQWIPLKLLRFYEGYWILVPDDTKLSDDSEYKNVELGVDVAQFGLPTDAEFYQCLVLEYGVLVLSVITMPDEIVRNASIGAVRAMFMTVDGFESYHLYYRIRQSDDK